MNNGEARRILAQLAEGVDPITGEVLPEQHVCNEPAVICALIKTEMGHKLRMIRLNDRPSIGGRT